MERRCPDHVIHYKMRPGFPLKCSTCSPPPGPPSVVGWFRSDGTFHDARRAATRIAHWNDQHDLRRAERAFGDLSDFEIVRVERDPQDEWPPGCHEWVIKKPSMALDPRAT